VRFRKRALRGSLIPMDPRGNPAAGRFIAGHLGFGRFSYVVLSAVAGSLSE